MPLKGQLLSLQLYGDPGMRQTNDLDLLVRLQDLERAEGLLIAEGYRLEPDIPLTPRQRKHVLSIDQHYSYVHETRDITLELHWRIDVWPAEQVEKLWRNCHSTELAGTPIDWPGPDMLLLQLCSHGANHKWFRLKWLGDVAGMLCEDRTVALDELFALANRFSSRRILAQAALLVHWLYGAPLSGPLCEYIAKEKTAATLAAAAVDDLLGPEDGNVLQWRLFNNIRNIRYALKIKRSQQWRVYLKSLLLNSSDFQRFTLPDRLFWLYYPLRPFFWFWRNYIK
jgi:hypothetical protein